MTKRFKLNFPDVAGLRAAWDSELSEGRFFIPTPEALAPFTKVNLALRLPEAPVSLEIAAEVVFVLKAEHCRSGQSPGLGLSVNVTKALEEEALAYLAGEWGRFHNNSSGSIPRLRPTTPNTPQPIQRARDVKLPSGPQFDEALSSKIQAEAKAFERRTRKKTHYYVLGVDFTADRRTIRRSYSELMRKYHPDNYYRRLDTETTNMLESVYQRVTEGYESLIDPEKRAEYDVEIGNMQRSTSKASARRKREISRLRNYSKVNPRLVKLSASIYDEARQLSEEGDPSGARAKLKLALRYNPHNTEARRLLGDLTSKED